MSSFIHGPRHIDLCVFALRKTPTMWPGVRTPLAQFDPTMLGQLLWSANVRSVQDRYAHHYDDPQCVESRDDDHAMLCGYRYAPPTLPREWSPVETLAACAHALASLAYQCADAEVADADVSAMLNAARAHLETMFTQFSPDIANALARGEQIDVKQLMSKAAPNGTWAFDPA